MIFRYPGGKDRLAKVIVPALLSFGDFEEYREPFLGAGSIAVDYLRSSFHRGSVWINDIDPALMAAWEMIVNDPQPLIRRIQRFQPSVEAFYKIKGRLRVNNERPQDAGFMKLAIHAISFSGLGPQAATPMGGTRQDKTYTVYSRWTPEYTIRQIEKAHQKFSAYRGKMKITAADYEPLILDESKRALTYLDPPYVGKGGKVYQYSFTEEQHIRLARLLRQTKHKWLLSYDDCPFIRDLYGWARISSVPVTYTICKPTRTRELLIWR